MTLRTRVDFTQKELAALLPALSNTLDHPDVLDVCYPDRVGKAAALRAYDKITRAYRKATSGCAADPDVFCNACDNRGRNALGPGGQNFGCSGCGYTLGTHPNRIKT